MNNWRAECQETGMLRSEGGTRKRAATHLAGCLPYQVTRLKLVKRSMYGRAGFPLLRQRFLLAGSC